MKRICVYCGSSRGKLAEYSEAASALAKELVKRDIGLVYGGASVGIMGHLANSVLDGGGEVIGIIPQALMEREVAHYELSELIVVESMHERKSFMVEISDGFIALPGGFGTIGEFVEVLTWSQLGFHNKRCAVLNVKQYYDYLFDFLDHAVEHNFIKNIHRQVLLSEESPGKLLEIMATHKTPIVDNWILSNEINV